MPALGWHFDIGMQIALSIHCRNRSINPRIGRGHITNVARRAGADFLPFVIWLWQWDPQIYSPKFESPHIDWAPRNQILREKKILEKQMPKLKSTKRNLFIIMNVLMSIISKQITGFQSYFKSKII